MKIRVTYASEVLGSGTFWEGDALNIDLINNLPAKQVAHHVANDQIPRTFGMWRVTALCGICETELNKDKASVSCGGDCLKCMAEFGDPDAILAMKNV